MLSAGIGMLKTLAENLKELFKVDVFLISLNVVETVYFIFLVSIILKRKQFLINS